MPYNTGVGAQDNTEGQDDTDSSVERIVVSGKTIQIAAGVSLGFIDLTQYEGKPSYSGLYFGHTIRDHVAKAVRICDKASLIHAVSSLEFRLAKKPKVRSPI